MQNRVPSQRPVLDFTPVPRKYRHDGWTPERQRAFIEALAETGSVKAAAKRINMSPEGAYYLRRQPGAESLCAAWQAAIDHGVQNLVDVAIDRALEGVPVPVFWKGEQVGEKRRYNNRLLMFILKHHMPAKYGNPLGAVTRSPETLAREAAENCPVCKQRAEEEADRDPEAETEQWLAEVSRNYAAKVRYERQQRRCGNFVAADFTIRQLTHIELILDCGGKGLELIDLWTKETDESGRDTVEINASPMSAQLEAIRNAVWEERGDLRPPLHLDRRLASQTPRNGPTWNERSKAMEAARRQMAEAQAMWEAAASEEGWAEWKGGGKD